MSLGNYEHKNMAFRADEARSRGEEQARSYLLSRIEPNERARSEAMFLDIVDELGPVIDSYPLWHPLVASQSNPRIPTTTPGWECGYKGLDHTVYFASGFVTCPYDDGEEVIDAVDELRRRQLHPLARITAERLKVQFYHPETTAVLVRCQWEKPLPADGMIPKSWAVPLLLEQELPCWRWAEVAETWETRRPYFLGQPHGRRSSLFVNQETGQVMKNVWNALIHTGMFGPIMVDCVAHR